MIGTCALPGLPAVVLALAALQAPAAPPSPDVEPGLAALVERFFATQEAEDADAYLALWSASAARPARSALQFVFASGDDHYAGIRILRVAETASGRRVRVLAERTRELTTNAGRPVGTQHSTMVISLGVVRENGGWRLTSEGPAADELAAALLEAVTADDRDRLLRDEADLVGPPLIQALARRGAEAAQAQRYAAAADAFARAREAAALLGDAKSEGEALQNLANARYFLRDFPAALEAYTSRLGIERRRDDPVGTAAALIGVATIRYALAEYGAALDAYTEALAIQEALQDDAGGARTLVSTGNVRYVRGDYAAAAADYRRSRHLAARFGDAGTEGEALGGLGRTLVAQGDYAAALEAFSVALAGARATGSPAAQGILLMSVGDVHFRLGNLPQSKAAFEEAKAAFTTGNDLASAGRVWQGLGLVELVSGRPGEAEQAYGRSREICGSASDAECVAGAIAGLAFAQLTERHFDESATSYRAAVDAFTTLGRRELAARAEVGLSEALTGAGRAAAAIDAATRARHTAVGADADDVLWRALVAESRARRALGQTGAAVSTAAAAASTVDGMRAAADLRPGLPLPRDTVAAFTALAAVQAERGDAAGTFDTIERLHAHELRALLIAGEREIAPGLSDDERVQERDDAAAILTLRARLARERALPKPEQPRIDALGQDLDTAVATRQAHRDALASRLPQLSLWRGALTPATVDELGPLLEPGTLLVHFVVDQEALVAVWAWRDDGGVTLAAGLSPVPRGELAERVARLNQPAVLKDERLWRAEAAALIAGFPAGLAAKMSTAPRLLVAPHDFLWRVPFEALPVGGGYVADHATVAYVPSVTAMLRTPPLERGQGTALLAVAPEIGDEARAGLALTAPGWGLPAAEDAAGASRQAVADGRGTLLPGAEATEAALRRAITGLGALYLAAPFRLNAAGPLFSPVLLAPGGEAAPLTSDDGRLELREIFNLIGGPEVVVLSDGAALSMRDGAVAMPVLHWAWQSASARRLVLTRWSTDADVNEVFARAFHEARASTPVTALAMRAARQALRADVGRRAPWYWAGWLLLGGF